MRTPFTLYWVCHEGSGSQLIGTVDLDFLRHDSTRLCTNGDEGSIQWNGLTQQVSLFEPGATDWVELAKFTPERDSSYRAEWENFLNCHAGVDVPLVS